MMFGAVGILMGTRFYASQEAEAHPEAKRRIVAAGSGQTVRSIIFDLSRGNRWPACATGFDAHPVLVPAFVPDVISDQGTTHHLEVAEQAALGSSAGYRGP